MEAAGHFPVIGNPEVSATLVYAALKEPVLNLIEWVHRRATLLAKRANRHGATVFRLDVRLQGEGETVFFDI
jgi:protocatechuate 3,4-dioxygenase alpha subunit